MLYSTNHLNIHPQNCQGPQKPGESEKLSQPKVAKSDMSKFNVVSWLGLGREKEGKWILISNNVKMLVC